MGIPETDPLAQLSLPPGFRFFPTDEELLVQYLCRKVAGHHFSLQIIGDIDLYKFDPWDLPSRAIFGEKEWYFFSPRDRKYPNGSRPNRVAGSGYWKATGTDKIITTNGRKVGIKKALVFYVGKAPKGTKTNWIMHEYRLLEHTRKNGSSRLDDWVLCRIYKKNSSAQKPMLGISSKEQNQIGSPTSSSSQLEEMMDLPEINDRCFALPSMNSLREVLNEDNKMGILQNGNLDWASFAGLNSVPELAPSELSRTQNQLGPNYGSSDFYVPSLPPQLFKAGNSVEDEAQSGSRTHRLGSDSEFTQQNFSMTLSQNVRNSCDPFGFGFRR